MTISSEKSKEAYKSSTDSPYVVPFMFVNDEDIEVVLKQKDGTEVPLSLGTEYQLFGAGDQAGGQCQLTTPLDEDEALFIRRSPRITQETDYIENAAFPAASHEAALDKLTMICQSLSERLDRTITLRISSAVKGLHLPEPEKNTIIGWNATQTDLENKKITDYGQVSIPIPVDQGGTGTDNVTDALINFGFGATGMALCGCETSNEAFETVVSGESFETIISEKKLVQSDCRALLRTVYGDEAQVHTGTDLSGLTISRNHVLWTLTTDSQFSDVPLPYDGTYVFHLYPNGHELALAASYKTDVRVPFPDPQAGEIRIVVERFNSRKTIVSLQNMGGESC
ncbi:hypothetical protein GO013_02220 [Pseudodesulfovibrio sp. JC047]|uniref:hypothetical protein n=1 Tax=Pseudodesulfovibrio sp. JC047 TaxID=2683199 RepID=UPI0013D5D99C|nr:hypothetical protein [Pseudodesulfovibrio sp. JC047]NDV18234.1 hypothetical protein [Pseudodesulfovibrio sp. JC047]